MSAPLSISVVIPTYQRAHLLPRALRSVLRELGATDEVIVVDDGSTDGTRAVVGGFADPRLRYVAQPNSGAGVARNRGVREASRDLVAFLDSDDEWLPHKLALQRGLLAARPEVLFCFTNFAREFGGQRRHRDIGAWHPDPRPWDVIMGPPEPYSRFAALPPGQPDFPVHVGDIYLGEMAANYILTSCLMVRRLAAGEALRFAEDVRTYEDWACFGRLARRGAAAFLDVETTVQYGHPGARLTDANQITRVEARLAVLREVWGADAAFRQRHGAAYDALVQQQEQLRIRLLLVLGRVPEARAALRSMARPPRRYRALARLPPRLLAALIGARRAVRARLGQLRGAA